MSTYIDLTVHIDGTPKCDYIYSHYQNYTYSSGDHLQLYRNWVLIETISYPATIFSNDVGLTLDVATTYLVRHYNANYSVLIDSATSDTVVPKSNAAPTIGTTSRTGSTVTCTWTRNGSVPDSWNVYRSVDGGAYNFLTSRSSGSNSYDDGSVSAGQTVSYKAESIISGYPASMSGASNSVYMPNIYVDTYIDEVGAEEAEPISRCAFLDQYMDEALLEEGYTDQANYHDAYTDEVGVIETNADASGLRVDFSYYWGTSLGAIYESVEGEYADDGAIINSSWRSKVTDFVEAGLENEARWKVLRRVNYIFRDFGAIDVVIQASGDGGKTWTAVTKLCGGDNDGNTEHMVFGFRKTEQFFEIKVEWPSLNADFQFLGVDLIYEDAGEVL